MGLLPKHRRVSLTRRLRRCQPGTGMRKIERANGVTHDDTTDRRRHESAATGNGRTDDNERQLTRLSGVDRQPQILSTVIRARRSRVNEPGLWRAGREGGSANIYDNYNGRPAPPPRVQCDITHKKEGYPSHPVRCSCPVCPAVPRWVASVLHRRYHWLHWPP